MLKDYPERSWQLDNSENGIRIFPPTLICLNLIRFRIWSGYYSPPKNLSVQAFHTNDPGEIKIVTEVP